MLQEDMAQGEVMSAVLDPNHYIGIARHSATRTVEQRASPDLVNPAGARTTHLRPRRLVNLRTLAEIVAERREPRWLLHHILERGVLAILAGPRGTFKSFIALDWAMQVAVSGYSALILSGEGAGIGMRAEAWLQTHAPTLDMSDLQVMVVERPIALTASTELASLTEAIGQMPNTPALIVVDTWSKFSPGLDENDNSATANQLSILSKELRDRYDCSVLIVAHTGHSESWRPRGASSLTANTDCEFMVSRQPSAMTVTVSRERFKDTPSLPPVGYEARVVDLGRLDSHGQPVTSLALFAAEQEASPRASGKNQVVALAGLRDWARTADQSFISNSELVKLLHGLGIEDRRRRAETVAYLRDAGILSDGVGGHTVNRDAL